MARKSRRSPRTAGARFVSHAWRWMVVLVAAGVLLSIKVADPPEVRGATYVVTSAADSGPGTFRQALIDSNASVGVRDTIDFNITVPAGPVGITLSTALPTITDPVTIDDTDPEGVGIVGNLLGSGVAGLAITSGNTTVRRLGVLLFPGPGIYITGAGGNHLEGNFIGTNGAIDYGNGGHGIHIDTSSGNVIGGTTAARRNIIVGNGGRGVFVDGFGGNNNVIIGNYIGLLQDGVTAMKNDQGGVEVATSGNRIGGLAPGERNVVSANDSRQIAVTSSDGTVIQGNYVGTNAAGTASLGGAGEGIVVDNGLDTLIGGTHANARNIIAGVTGDGIEIMNSTVTLVQNNWIGQSATGGALGNSAHGVHLSSFSEDNVIGGVGANEGNVIANNSGDGVSLDGVDEPENNTIRGNSIFGNADQGIAANGATVPAAPAGMGATSGGANGTACAGCTVDVYSSESPVQGRRYRGSTVADGGGNWAVPGPLTGPYVTATATDANGETGEFGSVALGHTVNSTNDVNDGTCNATHCSLREAINAVNGGSGQTVIQFVIGTGAQTISVTGLPVLTAGFVSIDGSSQPGYAGVPLIRVDGGGGGGHGLELTGGNDQVRALMITRYGGSGIHINGGGQNIIEGNYVGTDGTNDLGNFVGVRVQSGSGSPNIIGGDTAAERNVISGNDNAGVFVTAHPTLVFGNYIGVNAAGTAAIANSAQGVYLNTVVGAAVGGGGPGTGNVISGNTDAGVLIDQPGTDLNVVQGNIIGLNAAGTAAVPNNAGVRLSGNAQQNTIGAAVTGYRNIISGNTFAGVELTGSDTKFNVVDGNYIGTDITGTAGIGNGTYGIFLTGSTQANDIGVIGNLVSGNVSHGIYLNGFLVVLNDIYGNDIGVNIIGDPLPNNGHGIFIEGSGNDVGDRSLTNAGNTIAYNLGDGVRISDGSANNEVRGNSIHDNAGVGIFNVSSAPAAPVILQLAPSVVGTTCSNCEVEIFSDNGDEGMIYHGYVTASGGGVFTYTGTVTGPNITVTSTNTGSATGTTAFSTPSTVTLSKVIGQFGNPGFSPDGTVASAAQIDSPRGNFKTSGNVLYFTDTGNHRVRTVNPNAPTGILGTVAGTGSATYDGEGPATSRSLNTPSDVFVTPGGDVYIADTENCRIRKVTAGTISTVAGNGTCAFAGDSGQATSASLNKPRGVAVDAAGTMYIADTDNCRIRRVSTLGVITTIAGNGNCAFFGENIAATSAMLNRPYDVFLAPISGQLYIADTMNSRVRKLVGSNIVTVAGNTVAGYNGDNIRATQASLNLPEAITLDVDDDVLIADSKNHRIRRVSSTTGLIFTTIGTGVPCNTGTNPTCGDGGSPQLAQLNNPGGITVGSPATVSDSGTSTQRTLGANQNQDDGSSGAGSAKPATSCREQFERPVAALADGSLILVPLLGLMGRKRLRMFVQLLSARLRRRTAAAPA